MLRCVRQILVFQNQVKISAKLRIQQDNKLAQRNLNFSNWTGSVEKFIVMWFNSFLSASISFQLLLAGMEFLNG